MRNIGWYYPPGSTPQGEPIGPCRFCDEIIYSMHNDSGNAEVCRNCDPRVCAWCGDALAENEPPKGEDPICESCEKKQKENQ